MDTLTPLTPAEVDDLRLCGISSPEQLQHADAAAVWADLQKAQEFFPRHRITLTEARLQQICGGKEQAEEERPVDKEAEAWDNLIIRPTRISTTGFKSKRHSHSVPQVQENQPLPQADKIEESAENSRKMQRVHGLSKDFHAIHCNHSLTTYIGAFTTLLVPLAFASMIVTPILLLNGGDPKTVSFYGVAVMLLALPHMVFSRMALCSVCHMRIFTFANYTRNKAAHRLPLLGYTLATALHILIFMQFRCPACGTTMKLFGRHKGKPHHH